MINKSLIQDLRITFLCVWVILMLYGVYRFYKKTNFREISLWHFMLASCLFFWCGYITAAMILGIDHLHLLPFMPFGILTLADGANYIQSVFSLDASCHQLCCSRSIS